MESHHGTSMEFDYSQWNTISWNHVARFLFCDKIRDGITQWNHVNQGHGTYPDSVPFHRRKERRTEHLLLIKQEGPEQLLLLGEVEGDLTLFKQGDKDLFIHKGGRIFFSLINKRKGYTVLLLKSDRFLRETMNRNRRSPSPQRRRTRRPPSPSPWRRRRKSSLRSRTRRPPFIQRRGSSKQKSLVILSGSSRGIAVHIHVTIIASNGYTYLARTTYFAYTALFSIDHLPTPYPLREGVTLGSTTYVKQQ